MDKGLLEYTASKEPDVTELQKAYTETVNDLGYYFLQCQRSYDDRRRDWDGKSHDQRKHGADAFPWDGASDLEVPIIAEKIQAYVSLCMQALGKSNIRAYPIQGTDANKAKTISAFLKYMVKTYIPNFRLEMEKNANWLLEKGMCITYTGWDRSNKTIEQEFSMDEIAAIVPDLAEAIAGGNDDNTIIAMLQGQYPNLVKKRAQKALNDLRKSGKATLIVSGEAKNCPIVDALPADAEVLFPSYITDPQKSPFIFYRCFMTPQDIYKKVDAEEWDLDWADYVVEHYRGSESAQWSSNRNIFGSTDISSTSGRNGKATDYIEVLYVYQRLIDEEDGSEGIYLTIMHPNWCGEGTNDVNRYAKHTLLSGAERYPFIVTRLSEQNRRLYDVETMSDLLRGTQWAIKTERDSRVDKASVSTLPPLRGPAGKEDVAQNLKPGGYLGERRKGDFDYMPTPPYSPDSAEIERTLIEQADRLVGLSTDDDLGPIKKQFYVNKFLSHVQEVLRECWRQFKRYGPDEIFFRVAGTADSMKLDKGDPDEEFDIEISFDSTQSDPEMVEKKLAQFVQLLQLDRNGQINVNDFISFAAGSIDPSLADSFLQPTEIATQEMQRQVTDDLAKIFAGIEVPARPQGAAVAMQLVQQYASQPDIAERLQTDEAFAGRLQKYAGQYQFMMQQQQNAQIGRVGTEPARMGQSTTQNMPTYG